MVMFYDEYSSETFIATIRQYLNTEFVQPKTAQIESSDLSRDVTVIVQSKSGLMLKKLGLALPWLLNTSVFSFHRNACSSN